MRRERGVWGRCQECGELGEAPAEMFRSVTPPKCGFCGGALVEELLTLTEAMIRAGATAGAGWSRAQFVALGIPWPARSGWILRAVGRRVKAEDYRHFLALGRTARTTSGAV